MIDIAGGIVLGVVALYLLAICAAMGVIVISNFLAALHRAYTNLSKWMNRKLFFEPKTYFVGDGAVYTKADGTASYTRTSDGALRRVVAQR
jgi:hypothetical protein